LLKHQLQGKRFITLTPGTLPRSGWPERQWGLVAGEVEDAIAPIAAKYSILLKIENIPL